MSGYGAAATRTPPTFGGSWCGKNQFPRPWSGSTSASRRPASYATSARSRQQPDRLRWFEGDQGGPRQADHHSDPSKIGGATCQRCVRGYRVRQPGTCLASRSHIARGIAQIATGQRGDDELSSPNKPVSVYLVP